MAPRDRDKFLVSQMLSHLEVLEEIASEGKTGFLSPNGRRSRYSAMQAIELTAEAAEKVSGSFEKANPAVPWRALRSLRHDIAHPHDLGASPIDAEALWAFIATQVPKIRRALTKARFPPSTSRD